MMITVLSNDMYEVLKQLCSIVCVMKVNEEYGSISELVIL